MIGAVVVWHGGRVGPTGTRGELLPGRAERTMLPIERDRDVDARESAAERADEQGRLLALAKASPVDARACACGCGGLIPPRHRRKDGRLSRGQRGVFFLRGHAMRVRHHRTRTH